MRDRRDAPDAGARAAPRVALVTTSWPASAGDPDGHFVRAHARRLEREGFAVTVMAPEKGGAFGAPGVAARLKQRPWHAIGAARWVSEARREVQRASPDRVVAHWVVPCGFPIATGAAAPIDLVSHGADVRLLAAMPRAARLAIVDRLARRASTWTFVSPALWGDLARTLDPGTRARVEAVARIEAMPIDLPDVRDAVARRRRELGDARVAVCVARLVASKRVDVAIEHAATAARAGDIDALVVVGDGPERTRLERLARRLGVDVRFVGAVERPDALAWIGAAEVLLHASEAEGLSTVVREAEAFGTRVLRLDQRSGLR